MAGSHVPVMLEEAIEALGVREHPEGMFVDATFGGGGHARGMLDEIGPDGEVIGVDRDPEARERAEDLLPEDERFDFRLGPFDDVLWELVEEGAGADGVLLDLGLSSFQIEDPARGFSYTQEGPLDMRMDPVSGPTAAEFLNSAEEVEISSVLSEYGDLGPGEARRVAREIARHRPLETTSELVGVTREALGWSKRRGHPARRVFQAVRIHVNGEPQSLQGALEAVERLLRPGGRLVAITFHSGEDRIVKRFISDRLGRCVCPPGLPVCVCGAREIFRRGVVKKPSEQEVEENPRSGPARLRSATRTDEPLEDG